MTTFIQLHTLTMYPPSNVNRDDLGRPKTAIVGGTERTRISSQSLKRAWRTSDVFKEALSGHIGTRTKHIGDAVYKEFITAGLEEAKAKKAAVAIVTMFGKGKKANAKKPEIDLQNETLIHIGPGEQKNIDDAVQKIIADGFSDEKGEIEELYTNQHSAADIAMFGRMIAAKPKYNTDASIQVAHAITTHKTSIEDDFFTAVDDLNRGEEDLGAAHMGEIEFSSGVFYQYVCIDRDLLKRNLDGDEDLTQKTLAALMEAIATVSPSGKQNTFASRVRAEYILAEVGCQQPRTLANAFVKSVSYGNEGLVVNSVAALEAQKQRFDKCYGDCSDEQFLMNVPKEVGSLKEAIEFVSRTR